MKTEKHQDVADDIIELPLMVQYYIIKSFRLIHEDIFYDWAKILLTKK